MTLMGVDRVRWQPECGGSTAVALDTGNESWKPLPLLVAGILTLVVLVLRKRGN